MSRRSTLLTIALLLTFMSTHVVHTSAAEIPAKAPPAHKSKGKKAKKPKRHVRKHRAQPKSQN